MTEWSDARLHAGDDALDALHEALRRVNPGMRPQRRRKPITSTAAENAAEIARTKEYLGSVTVSPGVHASYPSASYTLCGLRRGSAAVDLKGAAPGCVECATVAARCGEIDNSAPAHWNLGVIA
jgi:hypothetical protein